MAVVYSKAQLSEKLLKRRPKQASMAQDCTKFRPNLTNYDFVVEVDGKSAVDHGTDSLKSLNSLVNSLKTLNSLAKAHGNNNCHCCLSSLH